MSRSGGRRVARVSMDGRALTRPQYDNKIVLTRAGDRLSARGLLARQGVMRGRVRLEDVRCHEALY